MNRCSVKNALCAFLLMAMPLAAQEGIDEGEGILPEEIKNPATRRKVLEENVTSLAQGSNFFASGLYNQLKNTPGNFFCSPYNITSAIVMPYAGAVGATKEQIHSVMHYLQKDANLFEAFAWLNQYLTKTYFEGPNETRLYIGNSIWLQRDFKILPAFANTMSTYFKSALRVADFIRNPEAARFNINDWVREKTQGRIPNIVGPDDVDKNTRLVLVSSIFMKAVWQQAFDPVLTKQSSFFVNKEETTSVPIMTTTGSFPLYQAANFTLLELPYRSTQIEAPNFSLLIFLPKDTFGLSSVETAVFEEELDTWIEALEPRQVIVQVPKFQMKDEFHMNAPLQAMGLGIPFTSSANFSGITGSNDLFLSNVLHKATFLIDEKGTEAIAATAVTISVTSIAPEIENALVFRADHPFLFMIVDKSKNLILFMGRLIKPE